MMRPNPLMELFVLTDKLFCPLIEIYLYFLELLLATVFALDKGFKDFIDIIVPILLIEMLLNRKCGGRPCQPKRSIPCGLAQCRQRARRRPFLTKEVTRCIIGSRGGLQRQASE